MGPFSSDDIYAMLERGEITDQDFAWIDGLPEWQPLSSLIPPAAKPAATPPPVPPPAKTARERTLFAAVCRYAIGISLCVLAIIAQDAHKNYSAPVRIAPETAGIIGGIMPVALYGAGLFVWYRYFKGHRGSIIGFSVCSARPETLVGS